MLEPRDLRRDDAQRAFGLASVLGRREIGAEVEKVVLDARQHSVDLGGGVQADEADDGVRLVHRAKGLDAQRLLRHAAAVGERGLALVAAARIDARQA